jgi:peptidoglycan hydrolase-like protein with peptidoglycan-binding domain
MQPTPERYKEIQQALADKGFYEGSIDGNWDAECVAALKRFQADQHLAVDGKLGALSIIALGLGPKREPLPPQFDSKPEPVPLQ